MSSGQPARSPRARGYKRLGVSSSASIDEINNAFTERLSDIQRRYADQPDRMVVEADSLYADYRSAYLAKDGANEDRMLPLTLTGPDSMLNAFGIADIPHQNLKVQMESQAQWKDGKLVKNESNKTETFINKDGKRESKTYENGHLIKHTIDGRNVLNK